MEISAYEGGYLRKGDSGLELLGARDAATGLVRFPPPEYVHGGQAFEAVPLGSSGRLYSWTTVHPGKAPAYTVAMVDFGHDMRVFGRVVGERKPQIDAQVRVVEHPLPDGTSDFAFEVEAA
jgi:uncharacterized protein